MNATRPHKNERGAVLVISLMFMVILALLGTTAVMLTTTDIQIGANYKTSRQSYYAAEAGLQEILNRMSLPSGDANYIGETTGTGPTQGWGRYIVLQTGSDTYKDDPDWDLSSDSLDNDGDGSTDESGEAYPEIVTVQTVDGTELNYLAKAHYKIENAQFNNGADNDEVVLYGQDFGYGAQAPVTGTHPVWVLTAIGASSTAANSAKTTLTGEVVRFPLDINAQAALACDASPWLGGSTFISGLNHDLTTTLANEIVSTIDITGADLTLDGNGSDNHGGKEKYTGFTGEDIDTLLSSDEDVVTSSPGKSNEHEILYGAKIENDSTTYLLGVWTTGGDVVNQTGSNDIYGGNTIVAWKDESVANTWLTLAQLLGITNAELQAILDRADVTMADTSVSGGNLWLNVAPVGITYIDNAASGSALKFSSLVTGSGLMYVTGNLNANNLRFKGLIYVEGTISLAGGFWLLGAMAVKGGNPSGSGGGTILYSKDALDYEVGNAMKFIFLSVGNERLLP